MAIATVTSKGQVTLPRDVRREMGLCAGDRIEFVKMDDGHFAIFAKTGSIKSLEGIFADPNRPAASLEDMQAAIEAGALRK